MDDALNLEETEEQIVLDPDAATAVSGGESEGEATAEPEFDVVLSEPGSQPGEKVATQASVDKLVNRLKASKAETRDADAELQRLQEEKRILELALQQEREAKVAMPNPADFDEGVSDPKFVEAQGAYIESVAAKAVQQNAPQPAQAPDHTLEQRRLAHAERAVALGLDDYPDAQDAAIQVLGPKTVNEIVRASDRSEVVLYYLGKNPGEAERINGLIQSDPVKATLEIGRLDARLQIKPKTAEPAPDPDEELPGSSGSGRAERGPPGATYE